MIVIERIQDIDKTVSILTAAESTLAVAIVTQSLTTPFLITPSSNRSIMISDSTDFCIDAMLFGGTFPAGLARESLQCVIKSMSEPQLMCLNLT
jgi:hypothetical protein